MLGNRRQYEVVGVIDRHVGRARDVAQRFGLQRHAESESLESVDWLEEVDAITLGTAPMAHYDLIGQALGRNRHVLTEKPFTLTVPEGQSLAEQARDRELVLGIVHNFQFARSMRALLSDLDRGQFGAVHSISAVQLGNPARRLPEWYDQLPFGLFYDESPHLLYLLRRVAGSPLTLRRALVTPDIRGHATPARIDAHYSYAASDGTTIPATLTCNFNSPISEWHLCLFGERYLGVVDIFRDIYLRLPNDGSHDTRSVFRTSTLATWQHWWQHIPSGFRHLTGRLHYGNETVFARFATAVKRRAEPEGISASDALEVLAMQHEIVDSAERI